MDNLKTYIKTEENSETLYTIIIYNTSVSNVINFISSQIDRAKNINNLYKKNKINERLYKFLQDINDNYEENTIINSIFLISDIIIKYKLSNSDIDTAIRYNLNKIYVKIDYKFCIEYIIDFFNNFNFVYCIKIIKNDLFIIKLNNNKEKQLENLKINNEQKIYEEVDKIRKKYDYNDLIIIYGESQFIKSININNILIYKEIINRDGIYKLYEKEIMRNNHKLLEIKLNDMKNEKTNIDLYVFGKLKIEIKEAIELYSLKELYIDKIKLIKLKSIIDESLLNFKIIEINSLENGDLGEQFNKDYNGIMGIRYYA